MDLDSHFRHLNWMRKLLFGLGVFACLTGSLLYRVHQKVEPVRKAAIPEVKSVQISKPESSEASIGYQVISVDR